MLESRYVLNDALNNGDVGVEVVPCIVPLSEFGIDVSGSFLPVTVRFEPRYTSRYEWWSGGKKKESAHGILEVRDKLKQYPTVGNDGSELGSIRWEGNDFGWLRK